MTDGAARMPALDEAEARRALNAGCRAISIPTDDAELIRLGENGVFRLPNNIIARVARSADNFTEAERQISVAQWLATHGIPAVRALDVAQPVRAEGRVVTLWKSASDEEVYGTTVQLGTILRRLHSLPTPENLHLPTMDPFDRARNRLGRVTSLAEADRAFLQARCEDLSAKYGTLRFTLPPGVIHGDANVGNLIVSRDGEALLSDLDGFSIGPREWDLILTAMYYDRYGWHTRKEYQEFVETYGHDVMAWDGYTTLADIREFLMVTWLSQNAAPGTEAEAELSQRIESMRAGTSRRSWRPF